MRLAPIAAAAAAVLAAAPAIAGGLISIERPETATKGAPLNVMSPAFKAGGPIPRRYTFFGQDVSPALKWSRTPAAKSYAILVEDPDAPHPTPFSHWVVWNLPVSVTMVAENAKGGMQGVNSHKTKGYVGPNPPQGDPPHRYHFQVLALDRVLDLPLSGDREALLAAAKGHVAAKGEVVGAFRAP